MLYSHKHNHKHFDILARRQGYGFVKEAERGRIGKSSIFHKAIGKRVSRGKLPKYMHY